MKKEGDGGALPGRRHGGNQMHFFVAKVALTVPYSWRNPMRTLSCWLMLAGGLLAPLVSAAEEDDSAGQDYVIKVWGPDEGLTESSVTDVAQTAEGYLWVGTVFGSVLRFDGTRFVSYNSANTPEFSLKWGVPRLMADRGGTLWIGMVDGGLTSWDRYGFRSIFTSTNQPDRVLWSAPGKVIFVYGGGKLLCGRKSNEQWNWQTNLLPDVSPQAQHCADAEGHIWYLQNGNKLGCWNGSDTSIRNLTGSFAGQTIKVLTADGSGNIWVGTDQSIAVWQTDHFETMTPTNGEPVLNVKRLVASGASNLWVEANGRMRRCANRQWLAESQSWNHEMGKRNSLRFLHGDREGGLWSGVSDMGLIHVAPDGRFQRLTTKEGLPSNTVHFAYEDRDGDIWTGYERGGLVQVRRRLFRAIGKEEGLSDSLINTVCEDTRGVIWVGTHSGAVGRYENGFCTNIILTAPGRVQDSCAVADRDGTVWIGAQGVGLAKYTGGKVEPVASPAQLNGWYPRLLLPARDGRLWVGTLASIISVTNGKVAFQYTAQDVGGHPTALAETSDGTVWAGTLAGFLLRWDGIRFDALEPPDRDSLGRIWALWPAPDGSLWAGTEEGGLLHWTGGRFFRYTTKSGLPSDSIEQILGDRHGNLWLGTRAGITRVPRAAAARFERGEIDPLPVSVYGQPDGLLTIGSAIICQPSCWTGRDGTLFFAMANSVAEVNPDQVQVNPTPPTVALEEIRADDKRVWPERAGSILTVSDGEGEESQAGRTPAIRIAPGRGDLEIRYTGLSLGSPLRVRFKYRLDDLENSWNDAGGERTASYRHLPPGEYAFHVVAYNSDGVCSQDSSLLTVEISPHFYQTLWFRGGAGLFAVTGLSVAVAIVMRQRMRRRLGQLERQHEIERERARIAQDLHDDLGAGLTEIGLLSGMLQDPSKFPARKQEALDRIVQRCHGLVTALDEIVWAINPRNDSVNSLGNYLCRYAQHFLEPTNIRCRLEMHEVNPDRPLNSEQRHHLFLAFEEALTNVVRHSGATEVQITISSNTGSGLWIGIQDNGRGISSAGESGADGLINLRERMLKIGGRCEINNLPAGGVAVKLSVPFERAVSSRKIAAFPQNQDNDHRGHS